MSTSYSPTHAVIVQPLAVERDTAAAMCGIGRSLFDRLVREGQIKPPRQMGSRARFLVKDLEASLAALPVSALLPPPSGESTS